MMRQTLNLLGIELSTQQSNIANVAFVFIENRVFRFFPAVSQMPDSDNQAGSTIQVPWLPRQSVSLSQCDCAGHCSLAFVFASIYFGIIYLMVFNVGLFGILGK